MILREYYIMNHNQSYYFYRSRRFEWIKLSIASVDIIKFFSLFSLGDDRSLLIPLSSNPAYAIKFHD